MKIESFILGAVVGIAFSNKENQKMFKKLMIKSSDMLVDSLNKKSDFNVSTTNESLSTEQE